MNKYRRIKYEDRCQIYALSKRGSSQESIAEVLGVSQSAVSWEMQRNCGQRGYRFKQAEAKSQARQAIRSKARKLTALMRCKIEAKLRQERWSPEQISGWLSEQGIKLSHERIYQMIWDDKRDGGNLWRSLRRRGKRYKSGAGKNAGRGLIPNSLLRAVVWVSFSQFRSAVCCCFCCSCGHVGNASALSIMSIAMLRDCVLRQGGAVLPIDQDDKRRNVGVPIGLAACT